MDSVEYLKQIAASSNIDGFVINSFVHIYASKALDIAEEIEQLRDRIEQLEAALREVVKVDCGFVCQCAEIARTALKETE